MGLLTDFFVATDADVQGLDLSKSPAVRFPCLQVKRTDVVKILQLQCLVDGTKFDDHLNEIDGMFARSASDDGPWIVRVPKPLIDALAAYSDAELQILGRRWAETEEWVSDGGTPEDIIPFLRAIAALAHQSKSENRGLYVWICL